MDKADSILDGKIAQGYEQQADAVLSQANPVSTTLYTVLDTAKNVRINGIAANITWATTQPTNMDVVITVDGVSKRFRLASPVSTTNYEAVSRADLADDAQILYDVGNLYGAQRSFLLEGRSVKVQVRITWATTQPTPLVCRVKYAKIP